MANSYYYSNTAIQTTLSGSVSSGALSIGVVATTGFPTSYPYVLALDYGAATEELVTVTAAAGTTLTLGARGHSGTSAQSHSLGAVVRHVYHAGDATDFRTHEAATSDVHGVTGALVGATMSQTLTNKTLTSPTVNSGTYQNGGSFAGTFTGSPTFSGAVTLSGGGTLGGTFTGAHTYSGAVTMSGGGTLSGTFAGTPTFSGNVTHSGEIILANLLRGSRAAATDSMYEARVTGDSFARWYTDASGKHWWSSGALTFDTNLYRSAADTLKTDDSLVVTGTVTSSNLPALVKTGTTNFSFSATSTVDVAVSFGVTFASAPKVTAVLSGLPAGSSALIVRTSAITTTGMTLRCNDVGGVSRTLSIDADWTAVG